MITVIKRRITEMKRQMSADSSGENNGINGRVLSSMIDDGLYKVEEVTRKRLLLRLLSFPCLSTPFRWMDKYATYNENYAQYTQCYLDKRWKFLKEIACQSYCKDSFAQIAYNFSNKFSAGLINNHSLLKCNIIKRDLSRKMECGLEEEEIDNDYA